MSNSNLLQSATMVFIPIRYGQILGVYAAEDDAMKVVSNSILKGQPCDLVVRPIVPSSNFKSNGL